MASGEAPAHAVRLAPERAPGEVVRCLFSCHDQTVKDDLQPVSKQDLGFDIEQALLKARKLWPPGRAHGQDNPFGPVAEAIVRHLARCGIRYFRTPPGKDPGTPARPYRNVDSGKDPGTPDS